jgi:hypothetical protein
MKAQGYCADPLAHAAQHVENISRLVDEFHETVQDFKARGGRL